MAETVLKFLVSDRMLPMAAVAGLLALFIPALGHLADALTVDPYYSHAPLVPAVSLFLTWSRRKELAGVTRLGQGYSILPLAISLAVYVAAFFFDFRFLMYVTLIPALAGLVLFLWGPEAVRLMGFPLAYLLFALPLPYSFTSAVAFPLQLASSRWAAAALDLVHVSALQEGVNIHIPGYSFVIEKGCSGLNSIIALTTLAALVAYRVGGPLSRRVFLVFAALPIALVANLARIVTVVMVAQIFGKEAAESFFHSFSSLFLFSLAFLILMATARYIGCLPPES